MEQNFEKLEALIKDDDKISTVAAFACEAQISIAESKEIFEKYVEINKSKVKATYILNGKKKGNEHLSVMLVKGENLEEQKELYDGGVNQIVFSIQKAKNIDFNVIALVDPVANITENKPLAGSIIGINCIKKKLRKKILPTLPPATIRGKSTIFTKQNSAVKSESVNAQKNDGDSNQNNKNKVTTQSNIASLFNKAPQNKKPDKKEEKQPDKKPKTNAGLSNFFTKQSIIESIEKQSHKEIDLASKVTEGKETANIKVKQETSTKQFAQKEKEQAKEVKKQDKKSDLFDSDTDDEILKDLEFKEEKSSGKKNIKKREEVKTKNKSNNSSQKKKKRGANDVGNDKAIKKRKRIIVEEESDSDDIFGSEKSDNENLIEKSDEEPEPVKVEKRPLPPKNKRRKAVDKMYEDEDGYIVTKTEYVYETPSEDENEPKNKIAKIEENPKPKIEKKASSNSENDISPNKGAKGKKGAIKKAPSGNQPTLMNFFKKK